MPNPCGVPVEVCADTATKLSPSPYAASPSRKTVAAEAEFSRSSSRRFQLKVTMWLWRPASGESSVEEAFETR
jgi:hypothetical protein